MPENGDRETRMDRIERALKSLTAGHDQFHHIHKQLLVAQVVQQDEIRKLIEHSHGVRRRIDELRQHGREVEGRIDKLVFEIGEFMRRPCGPITFR
jgi:hypothetical protein